MKLFIRRSIAASLALNTPDLPLDLEAPVLSISNPLNTSGLPSNVLDLPTLCAGSPAWMTFDNVTVTSVPSGIKLIKFNSPTEATTVPFAVKAAKIGVGYLTTMEEPGLPTVDVTSLVASPFAADLDKVANAAELNTYDLLRFRAKLVSPSGIAYTEGQLSELGSGNAPSLSSLTTRGSNPSYPYYQETQILPQSGFVFNNIAYTDIGLIKTQPFATAVLSGLLTVYPNPSLTMIGANSIILELDISLPTVTGVPSGFNDFYLYVPINTNPVFITPAVESLTNPLVSSSPAIRAYDNMYAGAFAALVIPLSYIISNQTYQALQPPSALIDPAFNRDMVFRTSSALTNQGALLAVRGDVTVSTSEIPTCYMMDPALVASAAVNFVDY